MTKTNHPCKAKTYWAELGPSSIHAYRVTCAACERFIRWGTTEQLEDTQVAAPGDPVLQQKFLDRVFKNVRLEDDDFTTENFIPGGSGEARLLRILRGKETLH